VNLSRLAEKQSLSSAPKNTRPASKLSKWRYYEYIDWLTFKCNNAPMRVQTRKHSPTYLLNWIRFIAFLIVASQSSLGQHSPQPRDVPHARPTSKSLTPREVKMWSRGYVRMETVWRGSCSRRFKEKKHDSDKMLDHILKNPAFFSSRRFDRIFIACMQAERSKMFKAPQSSISVQLFCLPFICV